MSMAFLFAIILAAKTTPTLSLTREFAQAIHLQKVPLQCTVGTQADITFNISGEVLEQF